MNQSLNMLPAHTRTLAAVSFLTPATTQAGDEAELWSEPLLIERIRRDPSDTRALDALIDHHWKPLFAHCQMLTLNRPEAVRLAQSAWQRLLQARPMLDEAGDFRADLFLTATNLWRRKHPSASANETPVLHLHFSGNLQPLDRHEEVSLRDTLAEDWKSFSEHHATHLKVEIDSGLVKLTGFERDIFLAYYLHDESCIEIARRCRQPESSIVTQLRTALEKIKKHFAGLV